MVLLWLACTGSQNPEAGVWSVAVDHRRNLYYSREISTTRHDVGHLDLNLKEDGTAELRVGRRFRTQSRRGKYARSNPNTSQEMEQSGLWFSTGRWSVVDDGVRVDLTERYTNHWTATGRPTPDDLVLVCRETREGLFCEGAEDDLRYLGVTEGPERRPWPGTRWVREGESRPAVLWFGTQGLALSSFEVEKAVVVTAEPVVFDRNDWRKP